MILAAISGPQIAELIIALLVGIYLFYVLVNAERM
ncbi:MAG TPA: potassium-transporting ATPase subunit F [Solirubrobacteraceae bacterium]|nr:potassium-transporting ATPase subunit F [Solirubrobacteraceae bacterium]